MTYGTTTYQKHSILSPPHPPWDLPAGCEALRADFGALPAGFGALPAGSEALPAGSEALPAGLIVSSWLLEEKS